MRQIPGFDKYSVSRDGRVFRNGKELRAIRSNLGYWWVALYSNGIRTNKYLHRLVLLAFVGEKPTGMVSRHINSNKDDNRLANLAYGTYSENNGADKKIHGSAMIGEKNHNCKLTVTQVLEIKNAKANGGFHWGSKELAKKFGVSAAHICAIGRGESWRDYA